MNNIKQPKNSELIWFKILIVMFFVVGIVFFALCCYFEAKDFSKRDYSYKVYRSYTELYYLGAKDALVESIDEYIDSLAPNSCMNGLVVVDMCEKYNIDIRLVIAQAQVESMFGTTGLAVKTNSVFNVMAFDGVSAEEMVKDGYGYTHPDHSIEPYLKLLNKNYLYGKKTEHDLMSKFVDKNGKRYASDPSYEMKIIGVFNNINNTVIGDNYKRYVKYKTILEK